MACKRCEFENQSTFNGEVAIHFPGLKGLDKPIVWVFPKLVVCLHCGLAEFTIPEGETRVLREESLRLRHLDSCWRSGGCGSGVLIRQSNADKLPASRTDEPVISAGIGRQRAVYHSDIHTP